MKSVCGHPADTMAPRSVSPDRYTGTEAAQRLPQADAVPVHDALPAGFTTRH